MGVLDVEEITQIGSVGDLNKMLVTYRFNDRIMQQHMESNVYKSQTFQIMADTVKN